MTADVGSPHTPAPSSTPSPAPAAAHAGGRTSLATRLHAIHTTYQGEEDRPLGGFLALMGIYGSAVGAAGLLIRAQGAQLPPTPSAKDLTLLIIATHKATRLLAKDAVTSPLRAPFTTFTGPAGDGEVMEEVRGAGWRHAVGELVTCPFCLSVWVASAFVAGGVLAPALTRTVTTTLTAVFGSDVVHLLYDAAKQLPQLAQPGSD